MQNLQVGLGAVLALDTSAFLARQPPPRQPETTRHDGITPSNTPPSIRHPTHRLLWDAPENRASGPPSTITTPALKLGWKVDGVSPMGCSALADIAAQIPESATHLAQEPAQSTVSTNIVG